MSEFTIKTLVVLGVVVFCLLVLLCRYLMRRPKRCSTCGARAVVESQRKPTGQVITSDYGSGSDMGGAPAGGGTLFEVSLKCTACGEEYRH